MQSDLLGFDYHKKIKGTYNINHTVSFTLASALITLLLVRNQSNSYYTPFIYVYWLVVVKQTMVWEGEIWSYKAILSNHIGFNWPLCPCHADQVSG